MVALGSNKKLTTINRLVWYREFYRLYGCHPLEGGFGRIKSRRDRRPGMALENPLAFYARHIALELRNSASMLWTYWRLRRLMKAIWTDPQRFAYRDQAITPPDADELNLSLYTETRGTAKAIEKRRKDVMRSARVNRRELEGAIVHDEAHG